MSEHMGNTPEVNSGTEKSKKPKKRISIVGIIALCLIGAILLGVLGVGGYVLIKLKRMSRNAVAIVKPTIPPTEFESAPPVELIPIEGEPDDLTQDYDTPLDPSDVFTDPIYQENQKDPDIINILLMGDDGRDSYDSGRSDSMMILSYNTKTNSVKIVSLLRDMWIYIPGRDKWNRINTAYRFGGVGLAINTINVNFDMDIQYYMLVHFTDLVAITDKLGGIDVYLSEREAQYLNNYSTSPTRLEEKDGVQHLDGVQVFCHSRNRRLGNGDWSRTERQRAVMTAFFDRAKHEKDAAA